MIPSIFTAFLVEDKPEDAIRRLAAGGFAAVELGDEHLKMLMETPYPLAAADRLRESADYHGVAIPQAHLQLSADIAHPDAGNRRATLDYLRRQLAVVGRLGVRAAVLHPGGRAARDDGLPDSSIEGWRRDSLRELSDAIETPGLRLAIENMGKGVRFGAELAEILDRADRPERLGVCLDTGHLLLAGGGIGEFVDAVGGRLIALHIADNRGLADDHLFPCGGGLIDWNDTMRHLRRVGYRGLFNLECPGERVAGFPELDDLKIAYARRLCARMLVDFPR